MSTRLSSHQEVGIPLRVTEKKPGLGAPPCLGVHSEARGSPAATPTPMQVWALEKGFREA